MRPRDSDEQGPAPHHRVSSTSEIGNRGGGQFQLKEESEKHLPFDDDNFFLLLSQVENLSEGG